MSLQERFRNEAMKMEVEVRKHGRKIDDLDILPSGPNATRGELVTKQTELYGDYLAHLLVAEIAGLVEQVEDPGSVGAETLKYIEAHDGDAFIIGHRVEQREYDEFQRVVKEGPKIKWVVERSEEILKEQGK